MAETHNEDRRRGLDGALDAALGLLATREADSDLRERVLARVARRRSSAVRAERAGLFPALLAAAAALVALGFLLLWRSVPSAAPPAQRLVTGPESTASVQHVPPVAGAHELRAVAPRRARRSPPPGPPTESFFPQWAIGDDTEGGPEPLPPLPEPQPVVVEELVIAPLELAPLEVIPLSDAASEGDQEP